MAGPYKKGLSTFYFRTLNKVVRTPKPFIFSDPFDGPFQLKAETPPSPAGGLAEM